MATKRDIEYFGCVPWRRDIYVNRIGLDVRPAGGSVAIKKTQDSTIALVLEGSGSLSKEGKRYSLKPGCVFLRTQDLPIFIDYGKGEDLVLLMISFEGEEAYQLLYGVLSRDSFVFEPLNRIRVHDYLSSLFQFAKERSPYAHELVACGLETLLLILREEKEREGGRCKSLSFQKFQDCCMFLDRNFRNIKSAREVAEHCHISLPHLCRVFKKYAGLGPHQYLLHLKVREGERRLLENRETISEISEALGFSDPFHFSKTFKKIRGIAPSSLLR